MQTNVQNSYNQWAESYDDMPNKTRDLDKVAMQSMFAPRPSDTVLELGCGTGKNTEWLSTKAAQVTAVDFSVEMLRKAQEKVQSPIVQFQQADITKPWLWNYAAFDRACCNLILEHIRDLSFVFLEASRVIKDNGYFFVSELHPIKQFLGSKARFELGNRQILLDCFVHHASDYFNSAKEHNFECLEYKEWFDADEKNIPRLITFLFQKKKNIELTQKESYQ